MLDEYNHLFHEICAYLNQYPIIEDDLQQRMRAQAVRDGLENWIIPAQVGQLFYLLTKLTGAKHVYEIGSYLGYSATWFAKGLPDGGTVVLTESNESRYKEAVQFLEHSQIKSKVTLLHCDALKDLRASDQVFDIILIDHDKPYYCDAYEVAKTKIKKGGLIIADNVLWRNRIVSFEWRNDSSTRGVLDFNETIMNDPDVESLILPIGDGVSLSFANKGKGH